jgi:hypothetical protein
MKVIKLEQGSQEWLDFRKGKITGTRLHNIWAAKSYLKVDLIKALTDGNIEIPKGASTADLEKLLTPEIESKLWIETWKKQDEKVGFYETIAERLSIPEDYENPMDRGLRLENDAAEEFSKRYKKKLEIAGCWQADDNENIINSPDRAIRKGDIFPEAVEIKCLNSASHIKAVIENKIPDEYMSQVIQYFIVNDDLQTLYFVFYDPRVTSVPFHCIEVTRESLGDKPARYKQFQVLKLKEIDEIVERLSF